MSGENEFDFSATVDQLSADLFPDVQETPDKTQTEVDDTSTDTAVVETDTQNEQTSETQTETESEQETQTEQQTEELTGTAAAPKTWRKEAAAEWAKLPPSVQAEIHKREEDMYKGLETYKVDAGIGNNFKTLMTPHLEHLQKAGVNVYEEINGLLGYAQTMRFGTQQEKMDVLSGLASEYGIDLLDLAEHSPSTLPTDPTIKALQKQISELQSSRNQDESRQQDQLRRDAQAKIDAFRADPKHEHFDIVEKEMGALIAAGLAADMDEAYAKAVKLNPITVAKDLARQTAEAQRKSQEKVDKAKKLQSTHLKTNARPGSATTPLGSMDDTLQETLNAIKSR